MIINVDEYLIRELNLQGIKITKSEFISIYRTSRKREDYHKQFAKEKLNEEEAIRKYNLYG